MPHPRREPDAPGARAVVHEHAGQAEQRAGAGAEAARRPAWATGPSGSLRRARARAGGGSRGRGAICGRRWSVFPVLHSIRLRFLTDVSTERSEGYSRGWPSSSCRSPRSSPLPRPSPSSREHAAFRRRRDAGRARPVPLAVARSDQHGRRLRAAQRVVTRVAAQAGARCRRGWHGRGRRRERRRRTPRRSRSRSLCTPRPLLGAAAAAAAVAAAWSVRIRWLKGADPVLFESFCGMLRRKVGDA